MQRVKSTRKYTLASGIECILLSSGMVQSDVGLGLYALRAMSCVSLVLADVFEQERTAIE